MSQVARAAPHEWANTSEGYHPFHNEDGTTFGSFQVFWEDGGIGEPGWYWWACFPGCIPDGDPHGPFRYSTEALDDADPARASLNLSHEGE
jgi:hypothetical protein